MPDSPFTEKLSHCVICAGSSFTPISDRDRRGQHLPTVICDACGHVFTNPRPSAEAVRQYYEKDYRVSYKEAVQPKPKHVYRAGKVALERLAYLSPILSAGCRLIDLGSGGGELLYLLRAAGISAEGIEPNEGYGTYAQDTLGLPVQLGGYQSAQVEPGSQDVVTAFHVLEHLEQPVDALRTLATWLRVDGRMLIEVPNIDSTCQWPASRFHFAHLQNFSPPTLALAGEQAGLVVESVFTSDDGGNVIAIFRHRAAAQPPKHPADKDHARRLTLQLKGHTALKHLLSAAPYLRPLRRLKRTLAEKKALKADLTGPQILAEMAKSVPKIP
jgi:2-polyprenyl-3-methyl-5-hydroxy-6-metoxy-1,4-benzoquinol methylase